jgi:hypothetical protein
LTTRHDLSVGIAGAVKRIIAESVGRSCRHIRLVSMSTTLATNALVEGQGGRIALVMVGFSPKPIWRRPVLGAALGSDPVDLPPRRT